MRMRLREVIRKSLARKGSFSKTVNGVQILINKVEKEFWIKVLEKDEKPRLWIYRREDIALNRFEEQAASLRR